MTLSRNLIQTLVLTALIAGIFLVPTALGQQAPKGTERAIGNWRFQSVPYRDHTCQISGTMQIRPDKQTGDLACAFTAVEACIGQDRWIVEQTCSVEKNGDQIAMRSSIINFIESDIIADTYMPDHFVLNIDSADRMSGQLISAVSAAVEFVRLQEIVS